MNIAEDFVDAVGHTPLIRLRTVSDETGCEILGKAEFMNPGGSVKDRAARAGCSSRAVPWSKVPRAIPGSAWRMSATHADIAA